LNDEVKEDDMGGTCSTNGGEEENVQDFGGKSRRKKDHKADLDVGGG
jgi:hypothetical protein